MLLLERGTNRFVVWTGLKIDILVKFGYGCLWLQKAGI